MAHAPRVFDHQLIARRLALRSGGEDFVTRLVLDDLEDRLLAVVRKFERALLLAPDATGLPERGNSATGRLSTVSKPASSSA